MATPRLTSQHLCARAAALTEAAGHLRLWARSGATEDPLEIEECSKLADRLDSEAAMWRSRAERFSSWPGEDVMAANSKTEPHPGR